MRFSVTFEKEMTCVIEADSREELEAACQKHCDHNDIEDWYIPDNWGFSARELRNEWNGQKVNYPMPEPDMGVANGECLAMEDYKKIKAKEAEEAQLDDLKYVDPRQQKFPFVSAEDKASK